MIFTKRKDDEAGLALITVVIAATVLLLLATTLVASAYSSSNISRHDQDWNAALAAAEGGIDDFIFRINENSNYWVYNASNPPPATDPNAAFTGWVDVAGGSTNAQFHYSTDVSTLNTDGRIKITSTGRVNDSERTVFATLRRRSFLDFLYFTDFETRDPAQYSGTPFSQSVAQQRCAFHWYGSSGSRRDVDNRTDYAGDSDSSNAYCIEISFITADSINGPLHTNDAFLVCGSPNFNGDTSTSWDGFSGGGTGTRYRQGGCSGTPDFANPGDPALEPPLSMPPSNSAIRAETNAGRGGCLYTGPTRIRLESNGTMTVKSPYSKQTNANCPTNGNGALPSNGVIYVQNVPTTASDPTNGWNSGCPNSTYNSTTRVWGPASGSYSSPAHPLGFPISNDITPYGCRDGDVFIEGALDGQLTVAAQNNIIVTWHLTYDDGFAGNPADLLGLVANNFIYTYHPVNNSDDNLDANIPSRGRFGTEGSRGDPFEDATINAAILSVNHSFGVMNYADGDDLGTLHVNGAIAQRYRGIVGTNSGGSVVSGYAKDYVYDQRLKYLSPPKFLDPIAAAWGVNTWAEVDTPSGL
jgi:hypothetical protein